MTRALVSTGPENTGLAIARALRSGLPNAHLTAVSRAPHGPALETDLWDEVWTCAAWSELVPQAHAADLADRLDDESWYVPASAAEAYWLADARLPPDHILSPASATLFKTTSPQLEAADALPVSVPDWMSLSAPVEDLHAFGRRHDWTLWMRTPLGERQSLGHWTDFDRVRDELVERVDNPESLYLQQQIDAPPVVLAYAAHEGTLLDAALVRPAPYQSNTYRVDAVPTAFRKALKVQLSALDWTGGGALELIEDPEGTFWLDTWRPCFGDEVAGIEQCGTNLPAQLVAASTGDAVQTTSASTSAFATVTSTLPAERSTKEALASSASPQSGAPLPPSIQPPGSHEPAPLDDSLQALLDDLPVDWAHGETSRSVLLPTRTRERFAAFTDAADRIENVFDLDTARVGLSIKTNPADRLLDTARSTGMLAETIHPDEMVHARRHGYEPDEIIVNGPVQTLLPTLDTAPYALFGDAVKDLFDLPFDPAGSIIGVRTRPPERGPSRFGVNLSEPERMNRLCNRLVALPNATRIGLHLHTPSSTLGHNQWWKSVERVLSWAQTIQDRIGRPVECLDLGGGWHPDDWLDVFVPALLERRQEILAVLPELKTLLLEPGKALSQPLGIVLSRVLDARPSRNEVILDASIAELSNIDYHPHRLLAHTEERGWHRLPRGEGRLLGRLCMEADILGRRRQVDHLSADDTVVVCDAGAYDASMTYPFGQGQSAAQG